MDVSKSPGSRISAALVAGSLALAASVPVRAAEEAKVDASYYATLGGFPVASGTLSLSLDGNDYRASVGAQVTGIASLVANRSATGSAAGRTGPQGPTPKSYSLTISGGAVTNAVDMNFSGGNVSSLSATELRLPNDDMRVPLQPSHKRGVVDPLAAFVVPAGKKDPLDPKACARTVKVFDGRVRYDLRLIYGSRSEVRGAGYSGPVLTCAVNYRPIAGYRPMSPEQQRFERTMEFSISFVPVGSTGVLIPYRVVVGTPMGLLVVTASRFDVKGTRTAEAVHPADH